MTAARGPRLAGGVALLVCLWIAVYWAWEPRSQRVTLHRDAGSLPPPGALTEPPIELPELDASQVAGLIAASDQAANPRPIEPAEAVDEQQGFDYIVRQGDTFESIASEFLGDAALWTVLARENPFVSPDRLSPGAVLRVPGDRDARPEPAMPPVVPRDAEYVVVSGDSLSRISQRVYGSARYTDALFQANRDRLASPNALRVGQILTIPPVESLGGGGP